MFKVYLRAAHSILTARAAGQRSNAALELDRPWVRWDTRALHGAQMRWRTCPGGAKPKGSVGEGSPPAPRHWRFPQRWEMEVQIPPGREGIEHGSPTSWVTALITRLVDKKGMTAAVVNPTSYFLCGFGVFFLLQVPEMKHFDWNKALCSLQNLWDLFCFSKENQKILFQSDLNVGFLLILVSIALWQNKLFAQTNL